MRVVSYNELLGMEPGTIYRCISPDGFPWDGVNLIVKVDAAKRLLFTQSWFHSFQIEAEDTELPAEDGVERDSLYDANGRYLVIDPDELAAFVDAVAKLRE
ncbi:MAG TPA: hypothetical protein VMZ31_16810 [Phycisphaerae bacterium]|nr:hypothetical protein [Phycisphaerae bacterium]